MLQFLARPRIHNPSYAKLLLECLNGERVAVRKIRAISIANCPSIYRLIDFQSTLFK